MAKVRIEMTGRLTGKVWVDGVEQENVTALQFGVDVLDDSPCRVQITKTIYPTELEVDGAMDVTCLDNLGSRTYRATGKDNA